MSCEASSRASLASYQRSRMQPLRSLTHTNSLTTDDLKIKVITIERNTEVKIKCHKCGNEYLMAMMRMDSNGKNLVCRNCLERKPVQKQEIAQEAPKKQEEAFKEYFCKSCKYSFKRAKHLTISTCPYCNSGSLMIKGSASRIIADASKMKGEF